MEEWMMYFLLAVAVFLILTALQYFRPKAKTGPVKKAAEVVRVGNQRVVAAPGNRRAGIRNRRLAQRVDDSDSDEPQPGGNEAPLAERELVDEDGVLNDPKLGAKKKAKLEAKLEKKTQREADEKLRKEKKDQDTKLEEERKKITDKEAEDEKVRLEEEKLRRQEQAQRELEEYQKLKEAFTVDEEGCEVAEIEEEQNLLEEFITHIKRKKVVLFEEIASEFGLKVPDAIARITILIDEGRLTGVMDDRGKFIYIAQEELKNVATFIKQRGRVSISDLVENSHQLINLIPETA